jgi:hypothetical protein
VRYDPNNSVFAGLDPTTAQAALTSAQTALIALQTGQQVATVTYAQGDGSKSVTYRATDIAGLTQLIRQLQAQLGIVSRPRRALTPRF